MRDLPVFLEETVMEMEAEEEAEEEASMGILLPHLLSLTSTPPGNQTSNLYLYTFLGSSTQSEFQIASYSSR